MAFGRNLMILGAAILALGAYATARGLQTLYWPRAEATITSAELLRQSAPTSRRVNGHTTEDSWNSFHVLYRYQVGEKDYVSGGVEPYDFGMQNSAGAAKMRERHPPGSAARIAYDPSDPGIAYLEPGPSSFALILMAIGSVFGFSGFWVRRKASQGVGEMNKRGATENPRDRA
jgi:hypothetical protein